MRRKLTLLAFGIGIVLVLGLKMRRPAPVPAHALPRESEVEEEIVTTQTPRETTKLKLAELPAKRPDVSPPKLSGDESKFRPDRATIEKLTRAAAQLPDFITKDGQLAAPSEAGAKEAKRQLAALAEQTQAHLKPLLDGLPAALEETNRLLTANQRLLERFRTRE